MLNIRPLTHTVFILALVSMSSAALARDYHVAPGGSDQASGTQDRPFRTIQHAATVAMPGDTCIIAPGVYRESVTPQHSGKPDLPITFRAATKGTVTITGTEPVTAWSKHAGHIYKANIELELGKNNQVFFDGKPLQEARWPNDRDGDPMTPDGRSIKGGSVDHIHEPGFPDNWQPQDIEGAVVWALADRAWSSWTTTVTRYDADAKKLFFPTFEGNWWVRERHNPASTKGTFYVTGSLKLLDAPGEWFYDQASQTLYLWAPGNADPDEHRVEAKTRPVGLNLADKSWLVIDGIDLFGCTLDLDNATHCIARNMKTRYISHTSGGKTVSQLGEKSGIYVGGAHNRLENCEIAYSAGNGVTLTGSDNAVVNCWIHHVNYIGAYCSPVSLAGMRHLVSHNTIEHTGRDGIKLGGAEHLIQHNDIGFTGRICHDLGVIYSGGLDGGNTRIRYNHIHDNPGGPANVGIYLDNYMKNYIVDHNVVWNVGNGIRLNRPTGFCMVLNNTVFSDINNNWGPWRGQQVQWGSHVINNLSLGKVTMNAEVVTRANLEGQDLAGVFDSKTRTPGPESPGKGQGISIEGIAPGEQVDIGAYHHSSDTWRAGHDFEDPPSPVYSPATEPLRNHIRNASFEYSRYSDNTLEGADPLVHWSKVGNGNVAVELHPGFNSPPANARNAIHGNSVTLAGDVDSGIEQVLTSLSPNTQYWFSGYAKHEAGVSVQLRVTIDDKVVATASSVDVKLSGSGNLRQAWRFVCVKFRTEPGQNSATVTIIKSGTDTAHVDDTGVVPAIYGMHE